MQPVTCYYFQVRPALLGASVTIVAYQVGWSLTMALLTRLFARCPAAGGVPPSGRSASPGALPSVWFGLMELALRLLDRQPSLESHRCNGGRPG